MEDHNMQTKKKFSIISSKTPSDAKQSCGMSGEIGSPLCVTKTVDSDLCYR